MTASPSLGPRAKSLTTTTPIQIGESSTATPEIQQVQFSAGATGTWTLFGVTLTPDASVATVQAVVDANYATQQSGQQMFLDFNLEDKYPASLTAGDLVLYAEIYPTDPNIPIATPPNDWSDLATGFTQVSHDTTTSHLFQSRVAYRVADGSETPDSKIHADLVNRPIATLRFFDDVSNLSVITHLMSGLEAPVPAIPIANNTSTGFVLRYLTGLPAADSWNWPNGTTTPPFNGWTRPEYPASVTGRSDEYIGYRTYGSLSAAATDFYDGDVAGTLNAGVPYLGLSVHVPGDSPETITVGGTPGNYFFNFSLPGPRAALPVTFDLTISRVRPLLAAHPTLPFFQEQSLNDAVPSLDEDGFLDTSVIPAGLQSTAGQATPPIEADVSIAANTLVNVFDDGTGVPKIRPADSVLDRPAEGYILEAVSAGDEIPMQTEGQLPISTGFPVGRKLYVGNLGTAVQTIPGSSQFEQAVGLVSVSGLLDFERQQPIYLPTP